LPRIVLPTTLTFETMLAIFAATEKSCRHSGAGTPVRDD
jgi:hypothetical protein